MVSLAYVVNLWRTIEMSLINCEINFTLTYSVDCVIKSSAEDQPTTFTIIDTKLSVPVVTLSSEDNAILQQLKSGFRRTINWNKYQSKVTTQALYQYLDFLIDPSFQGVSSF